MIQFHEVNGTSAILFMGSTGEVSMLGQEERHAIVRETMKFRTGRMNFYYGCTGTTTAGTIDYVRQAGAEGADGAYAAVLKRSVPGATAATASASKAAASKARAHEEAPAYARKFELLGTLPGFVQGH